MNTYRLLNAHKYRVRSGKVLSATIVGDHKKAELKVVFEHRGLVGEVMAKNVDEAKDKFDNWMASVNRKYGLNNNLKSEWELV